MFSPIFCRTPVSRDIDCYSLAKISEILAGADILLTPIFATFSAWRAGTISQYNAGESPPLKAGRPAATVHLRLHVEESTPSGRTSARSGRSQLLRTLPCHNSKEMLLCMRHHFADASILSTGVFCRRQHFVDVSILSTPTFSRHEYFVDTNILSMRVFC